MAASLLVRIHRNKRKDKNANTGEPLKGFELIIHVVIAKTESRGYLCRMAPSQIRGTGLIPSVMDDRK